MLGIRVQQIRPDSFPDNSSFYNLNQLNSIQMTWLIHMYLEYVVNNTSKYIHTPI